MAECTEVKKNKRGWYFSCVVAMCSVEGSLVYNSMLSFMALARARARARALAPARSSAHLEGVTHNAVNEGGK